MTTPTDTSIQLASDQTIGRIEPVFEFYNAMPTGVTVSTGGRIFINFPRCGWWMARRLGLEARCAIPERRRSRCIYTYDDRTRRAQPSAERDDRRAQPRTANTTGKG